MSCGLAFLNTSFEDSVPEIVMVEVLLTFRFGPEFDEARIRQVAEGAQAEPNGTPGLRSKELMIDATNQGAVHLYAWDSEASAREFFTPDRIELITALYGVRPTVHFKHQIKTVVLARPVPARASSGNLGTGGRRP